ncbi:ROK family protein [Paenibacillus taichungensis]|uniref:ROK family protein n=1 Tax=Paenibacillus taichungensis TaxID=484184 RepID=A0A329QMF6_9BACL|nr:ROK family protein [Paenibacillus taichungensis]RAW13413.1 ROK family protein [Paenibacillus taichungensis]
MNPDVTIAIDAGGTFLKGAVVLSDGNLLPQLYVKRSSRSDSSAYEIAVNLVDVIKELAAGYFAYMQQLSSVKGTRFRFPRFHIGFAFPGPFEYDTGVSRIRGLNKYEQLYEVNLKTLLRSELTALASEGSAPEWMTQLAAADIRFGNDAALFALGVSRLFPQERLLCLTLGTGLGSAFVENRSIVSGKWGIPDSGMLYAEQYKGGTVDDLFGSRGILALADSHDARRQGEDVYHLAIAARQGNSSAIRVWQLYGQRLGEMLRPYVAEFRPTRLILGGQIAETHDLFGGTLSEALLPEKMPLHNEKQMQEHVFHGIFQLVKGT